MSRLKIRMAACNIWSSLQESATVDISCLISDVFSFDFKLPAYGEVRRYLTSIAHHEIEKIQDGIIPMHQGGGLIQEGADNIDINTETVDGKNTFHSMARAVFHILKL
jgi:hypothetical protein